jgi:hypothetical protein
MIKICTVATSDEYLKNLERNYNKSDFIINVITNNKYLHSEYKNIFIIYVESNLDNFGFSKFVKFYCVETFFESTVLYIDTTVKVSDQFIKGLNIDEYSKPVFFRHYKRTSGLEEALYCLLMNKITFYEFLVFIYHFAKNFFRSHLCLGGIFLVGGRLGFSILVDWRRKYEELGIRRDQLSLSLLNIRDSIVLNGDVIITPNSLVLSPLARFLVKLKSIINFE